VDIRGSDLVTEVSEWVGKVGEIGDGTFAWRAKAASKEGIEAME
jgi:hypothetical protein